MEDIEKIFDDTSIISNALSGVSFSETENNFWGNIKVNRRDLFYRVAIRWRNSDRIECFGTRMKENMRGP